MSCQVAAHLTFELADVPSPDFFLVESQGKPYIPAKPSMHPRKAAQEIRLETQLVSVIFLCLLWDDKCFLIKGLVDMNMYMYRYMYMHMYKYICMYIYILYYTIYYMILTIIWLKDFGMCGVTTRFSATPSGLGAEASQAGTRLPRSPSVLSACSYSTRSPWKLICEA